MKTVTVDKALNIVAQVLDRNAGYIGIELTRGIYATLQLELGKEASDVNIGAVTDTAAE